MILTPEQLQDLGMAVFREAGVPEESAASVVKALVRAELDGLPSHGFSRIPFYVDQALSGKVKARAIPLVRQPAPAAVPDSQRLADSSQRTPLIRSTEPSPPACWKKSMI